MPRLAVCRWSDAVNHLVRAVAADVSHRAAKVLGYRWQPCLRRALARPGFASREGAQGCTFLITWGGERIFPVSGPSGSCLHICTLIDRGQLSIARDNPESYAAMTESNAVLASVSAIPIKVFKILPPSYKIPDPLPWAQFAGPLAAAEDAVARLDERLAKSPIRDGSISRMHFADACASLWLDGELVHLDDLVLHDAGMDVRTPTHELTRAHAVLRVRRRIAEAKPDWALSAAGLADLRGRGEREEWTGDRKEVEESVGVDEDVEREEVGFEGPLGATDPHLAAAFAAVDAANARAERRLA